MRRRPLPPVREESAKPKWRTMCESEMTIYVLVSSVGALCYANSLNGEFVHDDIPAIVTNGDVTGANPLHSVLVNDFWGTPMSDPASHKSYRPLTTLSFRINHALAGLSPWWWHACNAALHAACCALVLRAGCEVARLRRPFAAVAALLFAVHPVHTEAVAGVVGRADVLACLFFLASVLLYHGSGKHRVWPSVALAALSMLAKETGLAALVFNLVLDLYRCCSCYARPSSATRWRWKQDGLAGRAMRLALSAAALAGLRLAMLHGSLPAFSAQDNPPAFHPSFAVRFLTFCYLAAFNWWLLLCPWSLSHDWQMGSIPLVTSFFDPRNLLTFAALLALIALSYTCFLDLEVQRHTPLVVGLLLLVLPYLPASNLFVTVGFVIAERVLYIPSVGMVIITAYGLQLMWRRGCHRGWLLAGVIALAVAGVARTHVRNADWRTKETLLRADLAVLPHNAKLHYNFGNFLKDIEQQENAIKHYNEALRLWPSYASAHNNLGTLVPPGRAEYHFLQALHYNRNHVNAHYNLGKLYRKKNRLPESLAMLQRCIRLQPRFVQAHIELLLLTPMAERRDGLQRLLALEPDNWEHRVLYGNWLKGNGWRPPSLKFYLEAMRLAFKRQPESKSRGDLVSLRAACLVLRDLGQQARILQLITRWHTALGGPRGAGARNLHLRSWQLRAELAGRAMLYSRRHSAAVRSPQVTSTCLHHSQLEVDKKSGTEDDVIRPTSAIYRDLAEHGCAKSQAPKKVSISAQYKPIHNKSETGHKKSCPLNNRKGKSEGLPPYIPDHFIKTY